MSTDVYVAGGVRTAIGSLGGALAGLDALRADPALGDRCRTVARERLDADSGGRRFRLLAERLASR